MIKSEEVTRSVVSYQQFSRVSTTGESSEIWIHTAAAESWSRINEKKTTWKSGSDFGATFPEIWFRMPENFPEPDSGRLKTLPKFPGKLTKRCNQKYDWFLLLWYAEPTMSIDRNGGKTLARREWSDDRKMSHHHFVDLLLYEWKYRRSRLLWSISISNQSFRLESMPDSSV